MARRGLTGQLNMFDFFRELETNIPQNGELEMVSLMPDFEEEPVVVENKIENQPSESNKEIKNTNNKKTKTGTRKKAASSIEEIVNLKAENEEVIETKKESEILEVEETPLPSISIDNSHQRPVMQRTYSTKQGVVEIAYINYSKVRMCEPGKEPKITEFASSKEAVDFYVEQMQKLEELYGEE